MTMLIRAVTLVAALAIAAAPALAVETYLFDKSHTKVGFKIRHTVAKVEGRFRDYEGTIWIDRQNPAASRVEVTIQAASIDTDHDKRDADLRGTDFFDVAKYPTIIFRSTRVEPRGGDRYEVTGDLTMRGVTKTITIPVVSNGFAKMGKTEKAGFTIAFPLERKDYGITWNRTLDQGGLLLGDEVEISIEVEANRKEPEAGGP
jgi:polyisoprenoid-binding protein YceI